MLIRVSGGKAGIAEYLEHGRKTGRDFTRDELDQRLILSGSINTLDQTLKSFDEDCQYQKYLHITLSFKEPHVSAETLQAIDRDFQDYILAACVEDEFYYYSEAHLPKIKQLTDKNGQDYERFPHIHVVIPQYNFHTGQRDSPISKVSDAIPYIDAFQEQINQRYQLASPKDNKRQISAGKEGVINRYELSPDMSRKEIKEAIFKIVDNNPEIDTVDKLAVALKGFGEVKVRDSAKFGVRYINLRFDSSGERKAINLKDAVFLDDYLANRNIDVKREFRGQDKIEQVVAEWVEYKALEKRFIEKLPKPKREEYRALSEAEKRNYLKDRWADHVTTINMATGREQTADRSAKLAAIKGDNSPFVDMDKIKDMEQLTDLSELPDMDQVLHLDDIHHTDEIIYQDSTDEREHTRADNQEREGDHLMSALRERRNDGDRGARELAPGSHLLPRYQGNDLERGTEADYQGMFPLHRGGRGGITVGVAREIADEVTRRMESDSWTERINAIDARTLLDYLSYHHKLKTEELRIERTKAGADRIISDDRRYSAADYLTKQMHFSWPESKEILTDVLDLQRSGKHRDRAIASSLMWHRFQREEEQAPTLTAIHRDHRAARQEIREKYQYSDEQGLSVAQKAVKRRLLAQQARAELVEAREQRDNAIAERLKRPNERYVNWLHKEAQAGDLAALRELNRVYPTYDEEEEREAFTIEIKDDARFKKAFAPFNAGFNITIKKNGAIEYRDRKAPEVKKITDTYRSLRVHDRSVETIAIALEMAKERFGVDQFEISNARQEDKQAIEEAVKKSRVSVKLVEDYTR